MAKGLAQPAQPCLRPQSQLQSSPPPFSSPNTTLLHLTSGPLHRLFLDQNFLSLPTLFLLYLANPPLSFKSQLKCHHLRKAPLNPQT